MGLFRDKKDRGIVQEPLILKGRVNVGELPSAINANDLGTRACLLTAEGEYAHHNTLYVHNRDNTEQIQSQVLRVSCPLLRRCVECPYSKSSVS